MAALKQRLLPKVACMWRPLLNGEGLRRALLTNVGISAQLLEGYDTLVWKVVLVKYFCQSKKERGGWCPPVIPPLGEAEASGSLGVQPAWSTK